jgi:hypothetical protein
LLPLDYAIDFETGSRAGRYLKPQNSETQSQTNIGGTLDGGRWWREGCTINFLLSITGLFYEQVPIILQIQSTREKKKGILIRDK